MRLGRAVVVALGLLFTRIEAPCQDVVAAHAGVVHFSEGDLFIDDHVLDHKPASYPDIKPGSTLRTEKGRAEVLLTPNVFLRLDENSAVRMISDALTDTRLEFLKGCVIVDTMEVTSPPPVILKYSNAQVRFPKPGIYRLDSDTDALQAYSGSAEVTPANGKPVDVDTTHYYFFALDLPTRKFADSVEDAFYDWARDRSDKIAAENQLAAQSAGDASDVGNDPSSSLAGGVPSSGMSGLPPYNYPDGSFLFSNNLYNGGFLFGPPIFATYILPIVVVGTPVRNPPVRSRWPRGTPVSGFSASSGREPSGILGISHLPIGSSAYRPGSVYRPGSIVPVRPPITGAGTNSPRYVHPATGAPHPPVAAPHVLGHR